MLRVVSGARRAVAEPRGFTRAHPGHASPSATTPQPRDFAASRSAKLIIQSGISEVRARSDRWGPHRLRRSAASLAATAAAAPISLQVVYCSDKYHDTCVPA